MANEYAIYVAAIAIVLIALWALFAYLPALINGLGGGGGGYTTTVYTTTTSGGGGGGGGSSSTTTGSSSTTTAGTTTIAGYYQCNVCYPVLISGYTCPPQCSVSTICSNHQLGSMCVGNVINGTTTTTTSTTTSSTTTISGGGGGGNVISDIYCVGNPTPSSPQSFLSYYAPIYANGAIGNWTTTSSYPVPHTFAGCVVSSGNIYCIGDYYQLGWVAYYANVSKSGIGQWIVTTQYPIALYGAGCSQYDGYIFCVGGPGVGASSNLTYYAPISYTTGGIGTWKPTTPYPQSGYGASCTQWHDTIFCAGGKLNGVGNQSATYFAPISIQSGIGTWQSTTPYPVALSMSGCNAYNGYIYCVGGFPGSTYPKNLTYYAPIVLSGTSVVGIGSWKPTTPYPTQFYDAGCNIYSGYIYCVGGYNTTGTPGAPAVTYYAPLSNNGIGAWKAGPAYPITFWNNYCAILNESGGWYG